MAAKGGLLAMTERGSELAALFLVFSFHKPMERFGLDCG
jgi:hypothetical protein